MGLKPILQPPASQPVPQGWSSLVPALQAQEEVGWDKMEATFVRQPWLRRMLSWLYLPGFFFRFYFCKEQRVLEKNGDPFSEDPGFPPAGWSEAAPGRRLWSAPVVTSSKHLGHRKCLSQTGVGRGPAAATEASYGRPPASLPFRRAPAASDPVGTAARQGSHRTGRRREVHMNNHRQGVLCIQ
ncbi:PREDICTED: uncharacterized protein LOC102015378 [Chinchilla lanigera]|uniref:uncharacterized protein LOC102015378 n=1 Tax=Chinchilla lanigera TaxID=34839 RepID=UPI000696CC92|nr:PREDICTED: uncharacterized protein LOC102015378 [Chinchilla lanigera]